MPRQGQHVVGPYRTRFGKCDSRVLSKEVWEMRRKLENLEFKEHITHLTLKVPEEFSTQGMEVKSTLKFMEIDNMLD